MQEDTTQNIAHDVAALLAPYYRSDILTSVGALSLLPENAARAVRLETLAAAALTLPDRSGAALPAWRLRQILTSGPLARDVVVRREDPCENPFTEELTVHDGSYLVMPGPVEESSFILRHLYEALSLSFEPFPAGDVRDRSIALVAAVLALGDAVARRAGLTRGIEPDPQGRKTVAVPGEATLAALKHAVTFDAPECAGLLAAHGLPPDALDPVIALPGDPSGDTDDAILDRIQARPIVSVDGRLVVSLPGRLLVAARHALLRLAHEHGVGGEVARRYRDAVWATVAESLAALGHSRLGLLRMQPEMACATDGVFSLDVDTVLYVLLVTDNGDAYEADGPHGPWPLDGLPDQIIAHVRAAHAIIAHEEPVPQGILTLVVAQGVGRTAELRLEGLPQTETHPALVMTAADLHTISSLEPDDPLALWYYARAAGAVHRRARIICMGALDEYQAYRDYGCTFPPVPVAPDGDKPTILIRPGGAGELRREVQRARDWHGVPFGGGYVEVGAAYDSPRQSIYTPVSPDIGQLALLVEGLPLWVVGPPVDDDTLPLMDRYLASVDAVAYWLWQCAPSLGRVLAALVGVYECVYVAVHLPSDEWVAAAQGSAPCPDATPPITTSVDPGRRMVVLTVHPALAALTDGPHNAADRILLAAVLDGLRDLVMGAGGAWPDGAGTVAEVVDRHAPLGTQKRLLSIDLATAPDLDPRGLAPPRTARQAAMNEATHSALPRVLGLGRTRYTTKDEWCASLDALVADHYRELAHLVASLDPSHLMEALIAAHEAIVRGQAARRLNIPTLAAGLAGVPGVLRREWEDAYALDRSAVAARFVIEYAVARPPSGTGVLSLAAYDRLLALAALIIEAATERDLIRHDIIALGAGLVSSKDLSERLEAHRDATQAYREEYTRGGTTRLMHLFVRLWGATAGDGGDAMDSPDPAWIERIDAAARAEWTVGLTEILTLMGAVAGIGDEIDPVAPSLPLDVLAIRLAGRLSWPGAQVNKILELLSLRSRPDFLTPPPSSPPHKKHDVYPWRYNRSLSYIRRPLLLCDTDGGPVVFWGPRHLHTAGHHLVQLIERGRLEGRSKEMRSLMGTMVNREGLSFNNAVADLLQKDSSLVVRRRVSIREGARDLGDIDVLVADRRRRRLWALECKNIAAGRMAHELTSEERKLFSGEDGEGSPFEKHEERLTWLRGHVSDMLAGLGLDDAAGWTVEALIVVDLELLTPHLRRSPLRVVPFEQIEATVRSM